jgi:hypothetical protein
MQLVLLELILYLNKPLRLLTAGVKNNCNFILFFKGYNNSVAIALAEGNFQVFLDRHYLRVLFRINLHIDDIDVLYRVTDFLGVGTVRINPPSPTTNHRFVGGPVSGSLRTRVMKCDRSHFRYLRSCVYSI